MTKLTLQVRTADNLLDLLAKSESAAWVVAEDKVQRITHIQIVNFEGTRIIEGDLTETQAIEQRMVGSS
jgi:hypothetical protein